MDLTQEEADALFQMEKGAPDDTRWSYPSMGGVLSIPLVSTDGREYFLLDIHRGRLNLLKGTYQERVRRIFILARLCFGGPPHRNPDESEVPAPHFHLYREGYGDKWAIPAPGDRFPETTDLGRLLQDFMVFCNITRPPTVDFGGFT